MIYLRKNKEDAKYNDPNLEKGNYLQNEMILFEEYYNWYAKNIYTSENEDSIKWNLYQLADICTKCLIAKQLLYPVRKIKITQKEIKKEINISKFISKAEIESYEKDFISSFEKDMDECIEDFVTEVSKMLKIPAKLLYYKRLRKSNYDKYLKIVISSFFYIGLWSNLRIKPEVMDSISVPKFDTISELNYFDVRLRYINNSEKFLQIIPNTPAFISDRIQESFRDYKKLFGLNKKKKLQMDEITSKGYIFKENEKEKQLQFYSIHENVHFKKIVAICLNFERDIYILIKSDILIYSNGILQGSTKDSWLTYYYAAFFDLSLKEYKKVLKEDFMKLFGITNERVLEKRNDSAYSSFQIIEEIINNFQY